MARSPRPWFWESRGEWYVTIRGERVRLGPDRAKADREFHRLMAADGKPRARSVLTVATLCDLFLDAVGPDLAPLTREFYRRHLQRWIDHAGGMRAADVKPLHVNRWIAGRGWGPTTRRGAITSIKRAFAWAKAEGHLDSDPIAGLKRPAAVRRVQILGDDQLAAIFHATPDRPFRDLLTALRLTGARPGEVAAVTAREFDPIAGTWTLRRHKTAGKTRRPRVVYLVPEMVDLCRELATLHPAGPIFRNRDGAPWTRNAMACRFARLRKKLGLGKGAVAYALRHRWATEALARGVPVASVAELMGHAGVQMVMEHYCHLHEHADHLRDAARKATDPGSGGGSA